MPPRESLEALDVGENLDARVLLRVMLLPMASLDLHVEKKHLIAALSQALRDLLMLQVMQRDVSGRWNASLMYRLPWSEWCSIAPLGSRRQTAIS